MASQTAAPREPSASVLGRRRREDDTMMLPPRKKPVQEDVCASHGRHFGRTVAAMCSVNQLVTNALVRAPTLATTPLSELSSGERRKQQAFDALLRMFPGLEELVFGQDEQSSLELEYAVEQKGINSARSDDGKGVRNALVNWLTPPGVALDPPILPTSKAERGFNHPMTGRLLCPAVLDWEDSSTQAKLKNGQIHPKGDDWPMVVYDEDLMVPGDTWAGLFRGPLLVKSFKHIFTSPSSVYGDPKSKRGSNSAKHQMQRVTRASIAYVATLVWFGLQTTNVFNRTCTISAPQRFYNSVNEMLDDHDFHDLVVDLLAWWNEQIFPHAVAETEPIKEGTLYHRAKQEHLARKRAAAEQQAREEAERAAANQGGEDRGEAGDGQISTPPMASDASD
ncbi:hypothetical protein OF83DRAFT_1177050 [Amylostereum chailletii]|nr:hypothetical protein OF83DRAFT_1177050 [Amylostereum chailletii]